MEKQDYSMKYFLEALRNAAFFTSIPVLFFYLSETYFPSWEEYGVVPRTLTGLKGILLSPFIHGSFEHIFDNAAALVVLLTLFLYFFKERTVSIFAYLYFLSGIGLWLIGRPNIHIGASGIVYALTLFLATSGVISGNKRMWGLTLLIIFIYGSLIWGVFPLPEPNQISWEGHAAGAVAGFSAALIFRKYIPAFEERKIVIEEPDEDEYPYWMDGVDENEKP